MLTDDEAYAIIRDPTPSKVMAKRMGLSVSLIYQLRNGRARPHLLEKVKLTLPADTRDWRPIEGFPLYEVCEDGNVRNVRNQKELRHRLNESGYPLVDLHTGARFGLSAAVGQITRQVHRLVCAAFHGPAPSDAHEVAHNDGNPRNPHKDNLRWDTRAGNFADKRLHGTNNHGAANGQAKLTEEEARAIFADPRPQAAIARDFGISPGQVQKIKAGTKWKHLHETA